MDATDIRELIVELEEEETSATSPTLKTRIEEISRDVFLENHHLYKELENK
ncbi:hypothetical protein TAMA11512_01520 [Selenomonas sp. TAMA-11512]|uniref:hypothetical protein n=1 Tax=Selenomonas sp. TAMA-11512 TaxID=3095337 RepID=UPI00308B1171|nr:hypothetical protein TAMA11512_01520 [Selenomonas sp. TAMA-11512]